MALHGQESPPSFGSNGDIARHSNLGGKGQTGRYSTPSRTNRSPDQKSSTTGEQPDSAYKSGQKRKLVSVEHAGFGCSSNSPKDGSGPRGSNCSQGSTVKREGRPDKVDDDDDVSSDDAARNVRQQEEHTGNTPPRVEIDLTREAVPCIIYNSLTISGCKN
jgi:hypothetical protein